MLTKYLELPELTPKMALIGFRTNATVIIIVQMLIPVPVIQNIKSVMNICFEGDFANSQAFFKIFEIFKSYVFKNLDLSHIFLA